MYRLENNNKNIVNNGNKLSNSNLGYGLMFDGITNYVQLPAIPYFTTLAPFSIGLVFKHQNLDGLIRIIWGVYGAILGGGRNIFQSGNDLVFLFYGISQTIGFAYDISSFANQIIQVYYTFSVTDGLKMYLNGDLVQSQAGGWTLDIGLQNSPMVLGNSGDLLYNYNKSTLYDFKIFNKVLNQSEVTELYTYNRTPITATSNLITHLGFNKLIGTTTPDKSGNGNNGNLVGYNIGDKPIRDIQGTTVQEFII